MTADEYVLKVVRRHSLPMNLDKDSVLYVVDPLKNIITDWAGDCLCEIKLSGSRAKGTAIDLSTDLDLFISLSSTTRNPLSEIYNSLYTRISNEGLTCRKQNVSIGVTYNGKKVDLVPAKRQSQYGGDHSLYKRKSDSWTKTNIDKHISMVNQSGRRNEIVALKVWRENHGLAFPSILLETLTIDALGGRSTTTTANNVLYMLRYIKNNICSAHVLDPANTNNVLSDDLTRFEKQLLMQQAEKSLAEQYWGQIIW